MSKTTTNKVVPSDRELKNAIYELMQKYEFNSIENKGYGYIVYALFNGIKNMVNPTIGITTTTYPNIAKKFNTTPQRVERCIRSEIEKSYLFELSNKKVIAKMYQELLVQFDLDL